jgi:hypothetical protein
MGGDISVGVTAASGGLIGPHEPGQRHGTTGLERVDVDADPDARRRH